MFFNLIFRGIHFLLPTLKKKKCVNSVMIVKLNCVFDKLIYYSFVSKYCLA